MATVLVTGGTGMLGRQIVTQLRSNDHTVRIMSRAEPSNSQVEGIEWAQVDLETGQGVSEAVSGVDAIIHAATSPFRHTQQIDVDGTRLLLENARAQGASHIIYISIIGIDRIPYGYYRSKLATEEIIQTSGLPWSILRAAQFHAFADAILHTLTRPPWLAFVPTDLKCQPVDEKEVAAHLCEMVERGPGARLPDLAGPEVLTLGQMARAQLEARKAQRTIIPIWLPGKTIQGFRSGYNTCPSGSFHGKITWSEWLQQKYQGR